MIPLMTGGAIALTTGAAGGLIHVFREHGITDGFEFLADENNAFLASKSKMCQIILGVTREAFGVDMDTVTYDSPENDSLYCIDIPEESLKDLQQQIERASL